MTTQELLDNQINQLTKTQRIYLQYIAGDVLAQCETYWPNWEIYNGWDRALRQSGLHHSSLRSLAKRGFVSLSETTGQGVLTTKGKEVAELIWEYWNDQDFGKALDERYERARQKQQRKDEEETERYERVEALADKLRGVRVTAGISPRDDEREDAGSYIENSLGKHGSISVTFTLEDLEKVVAVVEKKSQRG